MLQPARIKLWKLSLIAAALVGVLSTILYQLGPRIGVALLLFAGIAALAVAPFIRRVQLTARAAATIYACLMVVIAILLWQSDYWSPQPIAVCADLRQTSEAGR